MTACFKSFDQDGSASISLGEIKDIIGQQVKLEERAWQNMMKSDEDGNNEMDCDEFK
jgi:Ca2+-binding EF-hand superfamily protein